MTGSKRKAKSDFKRKPAFRRESDRVLIVTEGSKTEPAYFKMLIAELGLRTAKVEIVADGGSAPINIVEEAEERLRKDSDFEQIYCVFDRDRHTTYDAALEAVDQLAKVKKYKDKTIVAITSVPCFEVWYLLHVSKSRKPYETGAGSGSPADALISDLKKLNPFESYDKRDCEAFFSEIAPQRYDAIARSDRFLTEAIDEGGKVHHENPSTRVHLLVSALVSIAENQ